MVGGYAFGLHAELRATRDLDLLIRSDEQHSAAVYRALKQYGAPLDGFGSRDFMDGSTFQIGQPPARADILQRIDGLSFDEAWQNSTGDVSTEGSSAARDQCPMVTNRQRVS